MDQQAVVENRKRHTRDEGIHGTSSYVDLRALSENILERRCVSVSCSSALNRLTFEALVEVTTVFLPTGL